MKYFCKCLENSSIKRYKDIAPDPLFLCEKKDNFLKRFLQRKSGEFLKFGEKNKQNKKRKIIFFTVPISIVLILTGGVCASVTNCSNKNNILRCDKPKVISLSEEEQLDESLLILNSATKKADLNNLNIIDFQGISCHKKITKDLSCMLSDAKKSGLSLKLVGGYEKPEVKETIYKNEVDRLLREENLSVVTAEDSAAKIITPYYELETGLSVRLSSNDDLDYNFVNTDEYKWMIRNCVNYGFVLRAPQGKEFKTGISFDPSLYRYVGIKNAKKMRSLNMCLEEYRRYLKIKN